MQLIQKPMKYSLKQQGLLQYFIVLKNSIFPHFPAFLINMKKVATARLVWLHSNVSTILKWLCNAVYRHIHN
ncbi:hypothetical protein T4A_3406 [Trichinella pseudospiralis]|uniref:Uncharacterized protein n=1 Tax=Trichinella pseudospiralis TaxID=6337 RepID=A0A0V1ECE8_TRIPS|nr:hypothetical protein T4A_3406 [Trichinella pseudospiralis]KRZ37167.1 hypothetical protein T4C_2527 [Trichinella pseudospiralis]